MTENELDYEIKIVQFTATCKLESDIDLNKLAEEVDEVAYHPESMPACARLKDPELMGSITIWKNGVIGLVEKSKENIEKDIEYTIKKLEEFKLIEE